MRLSTNILSSLKNIFYSKEEVEEKLTPIEYDMSKNIILDNPDILDTIYAQYAQHVSIDIASAKKLVSLFIGHLQDLWSIIGDAKLCNLMDSEDWHANSNHFRDYTIVCPIFDSTITNDFTGFVNTQPIKYVVFKLVDNISRDGYEDDEDFVNDVYNKLVYVDSFSSENTKTVYVKWTDEFNVQNPFPSTTIEALEAILSIDSFPRYKILIDVGYSTSGDYSNHFLNCHIFYFLAYPENIWVPYRWEFDETNNDYIWRPLYTARRATSESDGLMSNADKSKLDGIESGATKTTIDSSLSSSSSNPVQNKVINDALSGKASTSTATSSSNGLMSSSDKSKLDGVASNANNYSLPTASSSTLGGVKVGDNLSIDSNGILSVNEEPETIFSDNGITIQKIGIFYQLTWDIISPINYDATWSTSSSFYAIIPMYALTEASLNLIEVGHIVIYRGNLSIISNGTNRPTVGSYMWMMP